MSSPGSAAPVIDLCGRNGVYDRLDIVDLVVVRDRRHLAIGHADPARIEPNVAEPGDPLFVFAYLAFLQPAIVSRPLGRARAVRIAELACTVSKSPRRAGTERSSSSE